MSCLTTAPLLQMLDQLFADAERTKADFKTVLGNMTPAERAELMYSVSPFELYSRAKETHLAVSRETASFLYVLARSIGARSIVEFGTSFGISTLHLAAALRDLGGGKLITTEFEPSKVHRARANLAAAKLLDLVDLREGDALQSLAADLPASIDILFLDGAKQHYLPVLQLVERQLRTGALVIADNVEGSPEYRQYIEGCSRYHSARFKDLDIAVVLEHLDP